MTEGRADCRPTVLGQLAAGNARDERAGSTNVLVVFKVAGPGMAAAPSKARPLSASKAASPAGRTGGVAKDAPRTTQVGFNTASSEDDRLLFVSQALIGYKAEVQVRLIAGQCNGACSCHIELLG